MDDGGTTDPEDAATDTSQTGRDTGWARILLEPGLVYSAHQRVAIGLGLGLGIALPFRSQTDIVSDGLEFIASPNVDLRFRVRKWIKLVVQFRGVVNEQPIKQGEPPDSVKLTTKDRAGSFMTLFGLQATF